LLDHRVAVASENLDSCVSMVQSAKDWMRNNVSEPLDWACAGRILPKLRIPTIADRIPNERGQ